MLRNVFLASLIVIALISQLQSETVAITLSKDSPAIILSRKEAEAQFKQLCADGTVRLVFDGGRTVITVKRSDAELLTHDPNAVIESFKGISELPMASITPEDVRAAAKAALAEADQRLKALAAALNPMPDWPQFVMNNDPSVCNRSPKAIVPVPLR